MPPALFDFILECVFPAAFLFLGGYTAFAGADRFIKGVRSNGWSVVPIRSFDAAKGIVDFVVAGRVYYCRTVSFGAFRESIVKNPQILFVDLANPNRSVLIPGADWRNAFTVLIGLFLVVLGVKALPSMS
jgi:hypothetical protein